MTSLIVKRLANLADLEEALSQLEQTSSDHLRLPNSLHEGGALGIEAQLIQLIMNWIRRCTAKSVFHSYATTPSGAGGFDDLCQRMYGLCALTLADQILLSNGTPVPRRTALQPAVEHIENIRSQNLANTFKGPYVAIPCIRGPSGGGEFNSPLYNGEEVVGSERFTRIVRNALSVVITSKSDRALLDSRYIAPIAEIVRELFTNTHNHARHDSRGDVYLKNFRCVIFRQQKITGKTLSYWLRAGGASKVKFVAQIPLFSEKSSIRVLEISVVDGGPGLAGRWTGRRPRELDLESEKFAILECFKKHHSTQRYSSAGSGLTNVLRALAQVRGWFRLRTGRFSVEKGYIQAEPLAGIRISDIHEHASFAEGAAFTFTVPLVSWSQES